MRIHLRAVFDLAIFSGVFCGLLSATIVPRFSSNDLVDQADAVVTGTVLRTWSEWDANHKYIWTRSEIRVSGVHKGKAAVNVTVSELGGVAEGRAMAVEGSVRYTPGEKVFVFLKHFNGVGYRTLGWGQGKYAVDASGLLHADTAVRDVTVVDVKSGQTVRAESGFEGSTIADAQRRVVARLRQGGVK